MLYGSGNYRDDRPPMALFFLIYYVSSTFTAVIFWKVHFPQDIVETWHLRAMNLHNMNNLLTVTFSGKNPKTNGFPIYDQTVMRVEKNNLNKKHTYHQYFCQCIHRIYFMISKNIPLSENYGDMINFIASKLDEPRTKKYLELCPKNVTYTSWTAVLVS